MVSPLGLAGLVAGAVSGKGIGGGHGPSSCVPSRLGRRTGSGEIGCSVGCMGDALLSPGTPGEREAMEGLGLHAHATRCRWATAWPRASPFTLGWEQPLGMQ